MNTQENPQVAIKNEPPRATPLDKHMNFGRAFICSFAYFGLYMAVFPAQNITVALFEKNNYGELGFYCHAATYLAQGIASIFCVFVMEKISNVKSMAWGSALCLVFVVSLMIPAMKSENPQSTSFFLSDQFVYPLMVFTSVATGVGEGLAQPGAGKYISDCTTEETKGFYFAFFWSFYMGSQVFGNLIAAFVLGNFDQRYYVIIITAIGVLSSSILFFMKSPRVNSSEGNADAMSLLPPQSVHQYTSYEGEVVTVKGVISSMWKLTKNRRFMYLIPQFAWTGVSIAYYSGILVVMMQEAIGGDDIQYQFKMSMLALVLFGVGEIVGCFFIGMIVDKCGSKMATIVNLSGVQGEQVYFYSYNLVNITAMIGVTIAFIIQFEFNYLAWLMCFLWGICDSAVNTNTQELIGFEFDNNTEPFSVFNTIQCIANLTCQLIISTLHGQKAYLILTIACGAIAFLSCGLVFFFPYREVKSNKSAVSDKRLPRSFQGSNLTFKLVSQNENAAGGAMSHHAGMATGGPVGSIGSVPKGKELQNRLLRNSDPGANMEIKLLLENTLESEEGLPQ